MIQIPLHTFPMAIILCFSVLNSTNIIMDIEMFYLSTDSIEANVESASVNVEQGTEQLRQAKDYQVKT